MDSSVKIKDLFPKKEKQYKEYVYYAGLVALTVLASSLLIFKDSIVAYLVP